MITRSLSLAALILSLPSLAKTVDAPVLKAKWKPAELATACEKAEKDADAALAKLVAIPDAKRTFKDSFEALDAIVADYVETTSRLSFMMYIHPDSAVRDAGAACEERAGKYMVALSARKDLYLASKGYLDNAGKKDWAEKKMDAQAQRLVELTMLDFKRSGLELSDADREKLVSLRQRITELQTRFAKALNEDATSIEFTKDDLVGLPEDFVAKHESKDKKGVYVFSTKYPDYYPVMENAQKESTRRKMEVAFMNRGGAENRKLLDEALTLRAQAAKLLGYKVHQDFVTEDRRAKNARSPATSRRWRRSRPRRRSRRHRFRRGTGATT
jgi:thimet oligopeptidase